MRPFVKWNFHEVGRKPCKPIGQPSLYRSLCLLDIVGKIFEQMIVDKLEKYIEARSTIVSSQYGFRTGCSTIDAAIILKKLGNFRSWHTNIRKLLFVVGYLFLQLWMLCRIFKKIIASQNSKIMPNKIAKANLVAAGQCTSTSSWGNTARNRGIQLGNFATFILFSWYELVRLWPLL